jgi:hypothetical protein
MFYSGLEDLVTTEDSFRYHKAGDTMQATWVGLYRT